MEVKLQIDGEQLKGTVEEVFQHLTAEQKQELARSVLFEFLKNPPPYTNAERRSFAYDLAKESQTGGWAPSDYHINEKLKLVPKSPHETLLRQLLEQCLAYQKQQIAEFIKTDATVQETVKQVSEELKACFPKFVHDAMMAFMCGHMQSIGNALVATTTQTSQLTFDLEKIKERLGMP